MIKRLSVFLFGIAAYGTFLYTFLHLIGFVGNICVSKGIDGGEQSSMASALPVDLALIALFGLQHSLMARPGFKQWWTRFVPEPVERSVFVLCASICLQLLFRQWRPAPGYIWNIPFDGGFSLGLLGCSANERQPFYLCGGHDFLHFNRHNVGRKRSAENPW